MIERIVKLAIDPNSEQGTAFRMIFAESKNHIAEQPGCHGVHLLESEGHFFTFSHWESEADLKRLPRECVIWRGMAQDESVILR